MQLVQQEDRQEGRLASPLVALRLGRWRPLRLRSGRRDPLHSLGSRSDQAGQAQSGPHEQKSGARPTQK